MFKSKLSRLLCLLFSCIFFLGSFGVGVSAASEENLIEPNLKNWTILEDYESSTYVITGSDTGGVQVVNITPAGEQNGFRANAGALYDITSSYKVGDKYTLSFEFLNADKYIGGGVGIISSKAFLDYNGVLYVGLATSDNTGVTAVDGYFVEINGDNYNQYVDSTITYSFEMPSGVVNPCIFINFIAFLPEADMVHNCWLAFRDIKLVNESEAEEDGFINKLLNGILGLFVPSDDYFDNLTKQVQDMFSNSFGFAYDVTTFFTELMNKISDLLVANAGNQFVFTLPGQEFDFNLKDTEGASLSSHHIKLWDDITIDFSFFKTMPGLSILYNIYCVSLHMICLFLLLEYAKKTFEKVMA